MPDTLHDRTCKHCDHLKTKGECCGKMNCACRNVYREEQRQEVKHGIMADYYARKGRR